MRATELSCFLNCSGNWNNTSNAGVFYRNWNNYRSNDNTNSGFRAGASDSGSLFLKFQTRKHWNQRDSFVRIMEHQNWQTMAVLVSSSKKRKSSHA